MKNLILSTACALHHKQIELFIKSLRKYYDENVCFLVGKKDYEVKEVLTENKCQFLEIDSHKYDVQVKRYSYYLEYLKKNKFNQVLICDSRDIYFQSNPFNYKYQGEINFFLESKKIKDCPYNSNWLLKTYGKEVLKNLSEKTINCSGTTLGTCEGMKSYLELMINESKKHKYKKKLKYLLTFRRDKSGRGVDQAYANFIVHNKLIKNNFLYSNESGPIATVYYLKKLNFNQDYQLVNSLNKPYNIVHQYDKRWDEFKNIIDKVKEKIGIK